MSYSAHTLVPDLPKFSYFVRSAFLRYNNIHYFIYASLTSNFLYCVFDNGCIIRTKNINPCVLANRFIAYEEKKKSSSC